MPYGRTLGGLVYTGSYAERVEYLGEVGAGVLIGRLLGRGSNGILGVWVLPEDEFVDSCNEREPRAEGFAGAKLDLPLIIELDGRRYNKLLEGLASSKLPVYLRQPGGILEREVGEVGIAYGCADVPGEYGVDDL